ncbi:hypothetical protein [Streptomyces sp. AVP053U2]|uniref:hypothetical protein n=1 Tax=Streptomyces sp. AVP053U2 TaxID=1737066 RepID=UPI00073C5CFB|nr:hypothetical protein APS67_006491 [Streptomyces sp. AVP053U2]
MDPISAAALAALAGSVGGEAGRQAWAALSTLVRRPFRRDEADGGAGALVVSSGEAELTALTQDPGELERAQRLSTALAVRAALDAEFRLALESWWQQARSVRTGEGAVTNRVSGGTQYGPVVMGRDFSGLTLTTHGPAGPGAVSTDRHGPTRPAPDGARLPRRVTRRRAKPASPAGSGSRPPGEATLQFGVAELVRRADLPKHSPPVCVREERHQPPWHLAA